MQPKIELINSLMADLEKLKFMQEKELDAIRRRAKMIIKNLFGQDRDYLDDLANISFYGFYDSTESEELETWQRGFEKMQNLFNTIKEDVELIEKSNGSETKLPDDLAFVELPHIEPNKYRLRKFLTEFFNMNEIFMLCFELDIDIEELENTSTKSNTVISLIKYMENRGRLWDVVIAANKLN